MPKGYNSLNDVKTNPYEIGICPICSVRLTHGCEHSQSQLAQEWLAAVIVAEQAGYLAGYDPAPLSPAAGSTMKKTIHMDGTYPNPFIQGGEIRELTSWIDNSQSEEDMPF